MVVQRSVLLAVISVATIVVVSTGVIFLQGSIDPFRGNPQVTTLSSNSTGVSGLGEASTSRAMYSTWTFTVFTTVTLPLQEYSTYLTLEDTTVDGSTTQIGRTIVVTEDVTVRSTEVYVATKTMTSTVNTTTTLYRSTNATVTR